MSEERGAGARVATAAAEETAAASAPGVAQSPAAASAEPSDTREDAPAQDRPGSPASQASEAADVSSRQPAEASATDMESLTRRRRGGIELVMRIPVTVEVVLGTARMTVAELMQLGPGATVLLDRHVGEPIDVMVNGRLVARGEVVVDENDETRLGIRLTEIVEPGVMC